MHEYNEKMEEWEYLSVWGRWNNETVKVRGSRFLISFGYVKTNISPEQLTELGVFLAYHGLHYQLQHVNYETGFDKKVNNISELRLAVIDRINR